MINLQFLVRKTGAYRYATQWHEQIWVQCMAVATIEADEAVASSVFVQVMGTPIKKLLVRVILVIFGHFWSLHLVRFLRFGYGDAMTKWIFYRHPNEN